MILTRAARILEDVALLARFRRALVGFSIPTDDDAMRQIFEPGADPIGERLRALRALSEAGVRTFAVIQPVLPMNVERLVEAIAPFVRAVRIDRLYAGERVRHLYAAHALEAAAAAEPRPPSTVLARARRQRRSGAAYDSRSTAAKRRPAAAALHAVGRQGCRPSPHGSGRGSH